jgi:hypothetical protein
MVLELPSPMSGIALVSPRSHGLEDAMAFTEIDHDHGIWVQSRAEAAPAEDLWPVDEAALADAVRRRRRGRPVRVAGWACILACAGYAVWLGMAAAPRDAMVAWGTMGYVTPAGNAPAPPTSASPLADEPAAAVAVSPLPLPAAVMAPAAGADAGAPDAGPHAGRALAAPAPPRPKPAAPKDAATTPKPAPPITPDPDDPYEDVVSLPPRPTAPAYDPADL